MADMQPQMPQKASFLGSTWAGIKGYFKGGFAGLFIGAVIVGSIAAVVGAFFPDAGLALVNAVFGKETAQSIISHIAGPNVISRAASTVIQNTSTAVGQILGAQPLTQLVANPIVAAHTLTRGAGIALAGIGGATAGAMVFSQVGSLAGAVTGVVKSREAGQVNAEDVVNVAKISLAHGVNVGRQMEHAQLGTHNQDMVKNRRAIAMQEQQTIN